MKGEDDEQERLYNGYRSFVKALPRVQGSFKQALYRHPDQWYSTMRMMVGTLAATDHFKARPSDILLATQPKSGTTWLKALLFLVVNRSRRNLLVQDDRSGAGEHPFAKANPHDLVPFLEVQLYVDRIPAAADMEVVPPAARRLYASHIPYQSLPESIKESGCRVVYLFRNPLDTLVSYYHFVKKANVVDPQSFTLDGCVEDFINGYTHFGPFWDHALGYWNASRGLAEENSKVLFLKYEEMMKEPEIQLKKLAEFVGCPFTEEEEAQGVVERILRLSSLEHLRNLEVNKSGVVKSGGFAVENASFFRKGGVGDWKNHLTPEMVKRLCGIAKEKFHGTGLDFQISKQSSL